MGDLPNPAEMFDLTGEVALVTGASSGLGRRFAKVLAGQGAKVVLCARSTDKLNTLKSEIEFAGGKAACVALDVLLAGQHLVEHHAQGIEVRACVRGVTFELLGAHVGRRPHREPHTSHVRRRVQALGNSEV